MQLAPCLSSPTLLLPKLHARHPAAARTGWHIRPGKRLPAGTRSPLGPRQVGKRLPTSQQLCVLHHHRARGLNFPSELHSAEESGKTGGKRRGWGLCTPLPLSGGASRGRVPFYLV